MREVGQVRRPGGGRWRLVVSLALKSLLNRRLTAGLTVLSVAVSVALVVGVDRVRTETKASFARTISGADLIVGARGGPLNLLLYSIFRIGRTGDATSGISWESYQVLAARPEVAWTIPLSLGDAHRGFRVLGTNLDYFTHYRFGRGQQIAFATGRPFADAEDAVLGAEVAAALGYRLGDAMVVSHGLGEVSFRHHDEAPFHVVGVLARTGTPIDRTVHITLAGVERMHGEPEGEDDASEHGGHSEAGDHASEHGGHSEADDHASEHGGHSEADDHASEHGGHSEAGDHAPDMISAFIVGLKSRPLVFAFQRFVNEYRPEPLLAIVPGVALRQLWELVAVVETAMLAISALVIVAGLVGMLTMLLASVGERRRETAILRAVGAGPALVFGLLVVEAVLLAAVAAIVGILGAHGALLVGRGLVLENYGLALAASPPGGFELAVLAGVALAAGLVALLPAWRVCRMSLADGLTVRL